MSDRKSCKQLCACIGASCAGIWEDIQGVYLFVLEWTVVGPSVRWWVAQWCHCSDDWWKRGSIRFSRLRWGCSVTVLWYPIILYQPATSDWGRARACLVTVITRTFWVSIYGKRWNSDSILPTQLTLNSTGSTYRSEQRTSLLPMQERRRPGWIFQHKM
jgi:hypothetical protein